MTDLNLLSVFEEMHRLKNENEALKRELGDQAVRIDQLLIELGEQRIPRGAFPYDSLGRTHAMVSVDLSFVEAGASRAKRAQIMADMLSRELIHTPGLARIVDHVQPGLLRTTFYVLKIPGSKVPL